MTNEEIQRVMEFIIKQQETFSEGMEQMRVAHTQAEARISKLEMATVHLFNTMTDLSKAQQALTEKMTELAEAQAHTDDRLNALINIIEQGRNGESKA